METERKELSALNDQLKIEYQKGFTDVKKCSEILEKLKVIQITIPLKITYCNKRCFCIGWPYTYRLFTVSRCSSGESWSRTWS
jgi:hypothetical protein